MRYPSEAIRRKLVVAGIPESEHSVTMLAAKLPDFDPDKLKDMSPDAVAEILLYLIAKGFLSLPASTERALLDMPWGSHVCQFYNQKSELLELLVPYFKQGLERNEACVWLVGDLTVNEAKDALRAAVPELDAHLEKGQMQVRHYTELYTNPDGTVKEADELSEAFAAMGTAMTAAGYAGLRASGSVSWVQDPEGMSRFMAYETKVNLAIQHARIMAVCTYPAHAPALCASREMIHNHGKIFVKRGTWVHDKSEDAKRIEALFTSLATAQAQSAF